MLRVSFVALFLLFGITSQAAQPDEVPEALKALAGKWARPAIKAAVGETKVVPRLTIVAEGKTRSLLVGAAEVGIDFGGVKSSKFVVYDLAVGKEDKKDVLIIEVNKKKVQIEYTLEKDVLKITCKEKVPAGEYLKSFDISGTWKRVK